jgi:hypothetical protein
VLAKAQIFVYRGGPDSRSEAQTNKLVRYRNFFAICLAAYSKLICYMFGACKLFFLHSQLNTA